MREDDGDAGRGNVEGPLPFVVGPGKGLTIQGPAGGPLTFKARGDQTNRR
jgi:hypothetical protein